LRVLLNGRAGSYQAHDQDSIPFTHSSSPYLVIQVFAACRITALAAFLYEASHESIALARRNHPRQQGW
jgi:hypothetical protein